VQIQQTAVQSQRALAVTRQQVANKERERRILQLTMSEIGQTEDSVNVYRGVGKMWPTRISAYRVFSNIREKVYDDSPFGHGERPQKSREGLDGRHQHPGQKGELLRAAPEFIESDGAFQVKYLEKQFNDAQSQLRDIVCVFVTLLDVFDLKAPQFNSAPKQ
jgi:hypothetical protein